MQEHFASIFKIEISLYSSVGRGFKVNQYVETVFQHILNSKMKKLDSGRFRLAVTQLNLENQLNFCNWECAVHLCH